MFCFSCVCRSSLVMWQETCFFGVISVDAGFSVSLGFPLSSFHLLTLKGKTPVFMMYRSCPAFVILGIFHSLS